MHIITHRFKVPIGAPVHVWRVRAGRCVAPERAPARIPGTPCISDQRPGSTSPGSGRRGWLPNPGPTPRAPLPADSVGDPPHSMATIGTEAVENTPPPHEAGRH